MDSYYARLLDIYNSSANHTITSVPDRWKQAYIQIKQEMGMESYEGEPIPPTFDPPATNPKEFAAQYAEAVVHMMAINATQVRLPNNFMDNWRKAEKAQEG